MKKIRFLSASIFMALSIFSCSSDEMTIDTPEITETDDIENYPLLIEDTKTYGIYNSLGYGYNATGEYAHSNATGQQIIDIEKMKLTYSSAVSNIPILSQELNYFYSTDAADYSSKFSSKLYDTQNNKYFRKSITNFYTTATDKNQNFYPQHIYGTQFILLKYNRYRFTVNPNQMIDFLTTTFKQDLQTKSPNEIIDTYGTHILTDIYVGAKLDMVYQARTKNSNRAEAADALVSYNPNNPNGIGSLNYFKKVSYKSRGGDPALQISGFYNLDKNPSATIITDKWQNSCTLENSVLVDFGQNGLIPIYDMVQDSTKKAQLKQAVEQYLASNEVKLS